jgi:hypothetical protein
MQKCGRFPQLLLFLGAITLFWLNAPTSVRSTLLADTFNLPSWYYESDQSAATLGFAVSSAGDVNNDGYADVLVGAPKYSGNVHKAGTVFLFYGSPGGLSAIPQWWFDGDQTGADLGAAVSSAGDVNNDGYDDILVGAPRYNHDQSREGRVYAFYGSPQGLSQTPDWQIESELIEAYLGWSVATAGDVNQDGFDDVIVGAKWAQDTLTNEGMVQVYLGGASGLAAAPLWTLFGAQAGASLGTAVSAAGDINQDGFADVAVGLPLFDASEEDAGQVQLFCGSLTGLSQTPCWTVTGTLLNGRLGQALSGGGDVTGDGLDDLIVGAPGVETVNLYAGTSIGLSLVPVWTAVSPQTLAQFGTAVHLDGDLDGDNIQDVIIGAFGYSADQSQEGRIYIYYGGSGGPGTSPNWIAEGNKSEAEFGFALASSDVDGDGQAEVLVGSPSYRKETELRGRAFLFESQPPNAAPSTLFLPFVLGK